MRNDVTRQFPEIIAPYCIAFEQSAGALVFRVVNGKVVYLIIQYRHGHWEFPRGHIEKGETEREAAYREIEEETGLLKDKLTLMDDFREKIHFSYRARGSERKERMTEKRCLLIRKKVVFFLAQTNESEIILSDEHEKFLWLPIDEALKKLRFQNAKNMIRAAHKYIIKHNIVRQK